MNARQLAARIRLEELEEDMRHSIRTQDRNAYNLDRAEYERVSEGLGR